MNSHCHHHQHHPNLIPSSWGLALSTHPFLGPSSLSLHNLTSSLKLLPNLFFIPLPLSLPQNDFPLASIVLVPPIDFLLCTHSKFYPLYFMHPSKHLHLYNLCSSCTLWFNNTPLVCLSLPTLHYFSLHYLSPFFPWFTLLPVLIIPHQIVKSLGTVEISFWRFGKNMCFLFCSPLFSIILLSNARCTKDSWNLHIGHLFSCYGPLFSVKLDVACLF